MKHRIPNIGEYVHAWTSLYGEFIIKVTAIDKQYKKKTRIRGNIIKILKKGEKDIIVNTEREFGLTSIRDLTEEEMFLLKIL